MTLQGTIPSCLTLAMALAALVSSVSLSCRALTTLASRPCSLPSSAATALGRDRLALWWFSLVSPGREDRRAAREACTRGEAREREG